MVTSIGRLLKVEVNRRCNVRKQPRLEKTLDNFRYIIEIGDWAEICWIVSVEARFFEQRSDNSKLVSSWEGALSKTQIGHVGNEVRKHRATRFK